MHLFTPQVVGLPNCDEIALRGMLALEAALAEHGEPLPAASAAGAVAGRRSRQAYCPDEILSRTLAAIAALQPQAAAIAAPASAAPPAAVSAAPPTVPAVTVASS